MFSNRYLRFKNYRDKHLDILWPVHVFRVIYPDVQDKSLNLFQEAILGLYRAGCTDPEEISQLLDLNKELVLFITGTQLIPNGWINSSGEITPEGMCLLDGNCREKGTLFSTDTSEESKRKMGYVFWDVISQSWMPRFVTELNEIEAQEYNSNGYPVFIPERQRNITISPYRLRDNFAKAPTPDPKDLLQAYRTYRLDIHHAKQLNANNKQSNTQQNVRLEGFEFISTEPEPMYLWTSIYVNRNSDDLWSVHDPFGIRNAVSWMRKPLLDIVKKESGLAKQIGSLIGKPQAEKQSKDEWLRTLNQNVSFELLIDFPYLEKHKDISRYFASVKRIQLQISEGSDKLENLDSLLSESQKLIESVLKWMLGKWYVDLRRLPKQNKTILSGDLKGIYQSLNLSFLDTSSIEQLSRQRWQTIWQALNYKKESRVSLKGLLCAVLLSTTENTDHAMIQIPPDDIEIPRLMKLADLRNKASHSSGYEQDKHEVLDLSNFIIAWTTNFKEWL